jgi:hypothetical protein
MSAGSATVHDAPTQQFVGGTVGDRCAGCGTSLATDQLYCVNCGDRRGKPRFALETTTAPAAAPPRAPRRPRRHQGVSSSTALVAGVGTLLLAMGVGVLIGRTDNSSNQRASAPPAQIITVGGGGSGTSAAANTPSNAKSAKSRAVGKTKSAKANAAPVSKKAAAKAQAAASKVLGSSKNLPPATVTQGQSGHGPGYQNGHFTGTFFGQ